MERDCSRFKMEFKQGIYAWVLRLIKFIDALPRDSTCAVMGKQLLRSGTSVILQFTLSFSILRFPFSIMLIVNKLWQMGS